MFDPIKLMNILRKANKFKQKIESELRSIVINESAGEGMIKIQMNGYFEIQTIVIDPDILKEQDINFLEDLIKSSINNATKEIKNVLIDKIKNIVSNISFFQ